MYLKLAWRNIWRNRRRTLITISSIVFAVIFAIFGLSANRGSHDNMIENMARFHTGFIQIQDVRFEDEPSLDNALYFHEDFESELINVSVQIESVLPRIETFMLAAGSEQTRGSLILGIDLEKEQELNGLKDHLSEGSFFEPGDGTVVLGTGLANRLQVGVGDSLVLLGQGRFGMTAAGMYPISGLIRHPMTEFNNQMVYMSLQDAQWLLSADDHVTSILVTPTEVRFTDAVTADLRSAIAYDDELRVLPWPELMPELLQAIQFDIAGAYVMLSILYVVIAFGLFGTILTMTLERLREFGVLLSMGMQRLQLIVIVFIETFIIGLIGALIGGLLGFSFSYYFYINPIQLTGDAADAMLEYGFEPIMPFSIAPDIFYTQAIVVFILSLVICLYPAIKIGTLNILQASRS